MRYTLKKTEKLTHTSQYQEVYKRGKAYRIEGLVLALLPNGLNLNRLGISVSKKVAKLSIARNRIKRVLREAYRQNKGEINPGFDLVFIGKQDNRKMGFGGAESKLLRLCKKAGILRTCPLPSPPLK